MVTLARLSDWRWEKATTQPIENIGGGGGIRTHGGLHHAGFQDPEDTKSEVDTSPDKD